MSEDNRPERSEALVYCVEGPAVRFLVVSSRKDPQRMVIPGGRIEYGETAEEAAHREAQEEAGVRITIECCLGRLLREKSRGRQALTVVFLARMIDAGWPREPRIVKWTAFEETQSGRLHLPWAHRELIAKAHAAMRGRP